MKLTVNGKVHQVTEEQSRMKLLRYLREVLNLTGAKKGCGIGICGTCSVLVDNEVKAGCQTTVAEVAYKEIVTIEGFHAKDGGLHPLQQAFIDHGAIQCGFCTPGMVLTAHAFLLKHPNPTREKIRSAITGNLCRCTGYQQIIDAIEAAAVYYQNVPINEQ
ncbi:(2Fe-2S)-binding protein [bacterium]|nr:(2Fe-2S)-binding protein [bacterium]